MSENHSRAGKRVEEIVVTDEPHERYQWVDPWTKEKLDTGIPILKCVSGGNVIKKSITRSIVHCPECLVPARYDSDEEPLCPNCGIVCSEGNKVLKEQPGSSEAESAGAKEKKEA